MKLFLQYLFGVTRPFCKKTAPVLLSLFLSPGLLFALPDRQLSQSRRLCLSPHADAQGRLWIRDGVRVRYYRLWVKKSVWDPSVPFGEFAQDNSKNTSDFFPPFASVHPFAASVPMFVPTEEFLFGKTIEAPKFRIFRTTKPEGVLRPRSSYWFYAEEAGRPLSTDSPLPFLHPELQASDLFPELLLRGCLLRKGAVGQGQRLFLQATCPGALPDLRLVYTDRKDLCPAKALRYDVKGGLHKILYFQWKRPDVLSTKEGNSKAEGGSPHGRALQNLRLYFGRHPWEIGMHWD